MFCRRQQTLLFFFFFSLFVKQTLSPTGPRPRGRFTSCYSAATSHVRRCILVEMPFPLHSPTLTFALLMLYFVVDCLRAPFSSKLLLCLPPPLPPAPSTPPRSPTPQPPPAQRQNGRESIRGRHQQQRGENLQLLPAERPHRQELGR